MATETWLLIAIIALAVTAASLMYSTWKLLRTVRNHENQLLGLHYDVGLLAIALDDAGVPIHNDTREAAYHTRQWQSECDAGQE